VLTTADENSKHSPKSNDYMRIYASTNLKHHGKKYPQSVEAMIKMKKSSMFHKRCFSLMPAAARNKHFLHYTIKNR